MINILLSGAGGKMGKEIAECAKKDADINISVGVDSFGAVCEFPVFKSFDEVNVKPDVIIDFSNPAMLDGLLSFAIKNNIPAVLATTGYSDEQLSAIDAASKKIPVFFTFNMSLGINLLCALSKKAARILGSDFDIEIIEKHHNQKIDAPSGTAIMLAKAINETFDDKYNYEYDRHSVRRKRTQNEIGIHSVRGGTIVGEHEVLFAGSNETISLTHSAQSKEVFAFGALRAAKFISKMPSGIYDMSALLNI